MASRELRMRWREEGRCTYCGGESEVVEGKPRKTCVPCRERAAVRTQEYRDRAAGRKLIQAGVAGLPLPKDGVIRPRYLVASNIQAMAPRGVIVVTRAWFYLCRQAVRALDGPNRVVAESQLRMMEHAYREAVTHTEE